MKRITIGVVCLVRHTYDFKAATADYARIKGELRADERYDWALVENPIQSVEDGEAAARWLAARVPDAVVIISGTFHLGHLALQIQRYNQAPLLLWALSEPPYDGGKLRYNSVCGVNLNASNLYKAGVRNYSIHVGDHIDEDWVKAVAMNGLMSHAHVGLLGYRADGFFNLDISDLTLRDRYGVLVDHYELFEAFGQPGSGDTKEITDCFDCSGVTEEQVRKVADLRKGFGDFIDKNKLDAVAVRCWPEFANNYGISPCAAMSVLNAEGASIACEGDVEGALALLASRALTDEAPFFADFSQMNFEEDFALMWHCGVAPYTLWDERSVRSLDTYFAGGRGVTVDFVMKPGTVTVYRIDTVPDQGTRVFAVRGESLPMEKDLKGSFTKVRFEQNVDDVFRTITDHGFAHHVVMTYGDHLETIRTYTRLMNYPFFTAGG